MPPSFTTIPARRPVIAITLGACLLVSLLPGCQTVPASTATATLALLPSPQALTPTAAVRPSASATHTATVEPTASPTVQKTTSPTPTEGTPEWFQIISKTRTLPAIALTDMGSPPGQTWWEAPNGKWIAEDEIFIRTSPTRRMALQVASTDGKQRWTIYPFPPEKTARYSVAGWSADVAYLYVAYRFGYFDGPGHLGTNGLLRLDLHDGTLTPFLNFGEDIMSMFPFAFSSPGDFLSYVQPAKPQRLVVLNLNTGKKIGADLDPYFSDAGDLKWSSDRKQLLLINSRFDGGGLAGNKQTDGLFWVKILDDRLEISEVARFDGRIKIMDWKDNRVQIDRYNDGAANETAYVYLSSMKTVIITQTPTPPSP